MLFAHTSVTCVCVLRVYDAAKAAPQQQQQQQQRTQNASRRSQVADIGVMHAPPLPKQTKAAAWKNENGNWEKPRTDRRRACPFAGSKGQLKRDGDAESAQLTFFFFFF